MDDVFKKQPDPTFPPEGDIPCREAHKIDGIIPDLSVNATAEKYDGRLCDCGKISFHKDFCGCGSDGWKIVTRQNINYGG